MSKKSSCTLLVCLVIAGIGSKNSPAQSQAQPAHWGFRPILTPPSFSEKALAHISQNAHISLERLLLADEFTRTLPSTGRTFWRGLVLDREGRGQLLYEVIVDVHSGDILDSLEVKGSWEAERSAYRERYGRQVLELVARRRGLAAERLRLADDVLESHPLTGVTFWRVKVTDVQGESTYELALDARGQVLDPQALQRAELEASRARYGRVEPALYYLLQT
jgi:hypothetical protein